MGPQILDAKGKEGSNNSYFWMNNGKGRVVPVPAEREKQMSKLGYMHTDKKEQSDSPESNIRLHRKPKPKADVIMAELLKELIRQNAQKNAIVEPVEKVQKAKPLKKVKPVEKAEPTDKV